MKKVLLSILLLSFSLSVFADPGSVLRFWCPANVKFWDDTKKDFYCDFFSTYSEGKALIGGININILYRVSPILDVDIKGQLGDVQGGRLYIFVTPISKIAAVYDWATEGRLKSCINVTSANVDGYQTLKNHILEKRCTNLERQTANLDKITQKIQELYNQMINLLAGTPNKAELDAIKERVSNLEKQKEIVKKNPSRFVDLDFDV